METIKNKQKISIIGPSGSGKSTLAKALGEILDLPVHHIDCLYHLPNGGTDDERQYIDKIAKITSQEKWIIDGTYSRTLGNRFLQSDLIIFLDFSQEFCVQSVTKRQFGSSRVGLPEYYVATEQGLERLVSHHIPRFQEMVKNHIAPLVNQYKDKVLIFKTREEVDEFIGSLKGGN